MVGIVSKPKAVTPEQVAGRWLFVDPATLAALADAGYELVEPETPPEPAVPRAVYTVNKMNAFVSTHELKGYRLIFQDWCSETWRFDCPDGAIIFLVKRRYQLPGQATARRALRTQQ